MAPAIPPTETRTMKTLHTAFFAALITAAVFAPGARNVRANQPPPDLMIGSKVFCIEPTRRLSEMVPGYGSNSQVVVRDIQGSWLLLEFPSGQKHAIWVNFDQVVSYSTEL